MTKKKIIKSIIIILFISVIFISLSYIIGDICTIESNIKNYCKKHDAMTFSAITKFDWDIAYVDYQCYGIGEDIKEKYGLSGDLEQIPTD